MEPRPEGAPKSQKRKQIAWQVSEGPPAWENCADEAVFKGPRVRAGSDDYRIRIRFDPSDREQFTYVTERNGKPRTEESREEMIAEIWPFLGIFLLALLLMVLVLETGLVLPRQFGYR